MKKIIYVLFCLLTTAAQAQGVMTIEKMLQLGKVHPMGVTKDGKQIIYSVSTYNLKEGKSTVNKYSIPVTGGTATELKTTKGLLSNDKIAPDGKHSISSSEVKIKSVLGTDIYPEMEKSNARIYTGLDYRHWDKWSDGKFDHVFINTLADGKVIDSIDIMKGEPYYCPQKPFGGEEDYIWNPNGKEVLYVTKKKYGTAYTVSTNTDIYLYNLETKTTKDLTEGMMGYDISPEFSSQGILAHLSMKTDGYESDKNDIVIDHNGKMNITQDWDGTVSSFKWSNDGKQIYFIAPIDGTEQLFQISYNATTNKAGEVKELTKGDFDINSIVGESSNHLIVTRADMNHASEIYSVDIHTGNMKQITHVNDTIYSGIAMGKIERRYITTADGKKMMTWVVYPPHFDSTKKYPTLLYCQGGPQAEVSQFYSFRWNFQLMAANGYIIVAPNRRGLPGFGVKWNEEISKHYGEQDMQDYLNAIDAVAKEPFVDNNRLGCIGASYGGYSVYFLAGMHEKRFKTFIAHDGIFDWRSMYSTTDEMFFVNHDLGGSYWDKSNTDAQNAYTKFNPVNFVEKWDTPIMIIQGGRDYRVPPAQGLGAFQAAQLRGIKSKLLFFPDENHWVLNNQNAYIWQREFFNWLDETLK